MSHTETLEKTITTLPNLYSVIFINDDYTTQDFVVFVLQQVFNYDINSAFTKMNEVHVYGKSVIGMYLHETANQKKFEVDELSKQHQHPLQVILEQN